MLPDLTRASEYARLLASVGRRLSWATAVAVGPAVRNIEDGDRVLFDPDERAEVELHGKEFVLLRERDVHAVGLVDRDPLVGTPPGPNRTGPVVARTGI